MARGGRGFRESFGGVRFVEQDLTLEIAPLDEIAIDQPQTPDPARANNSACTDPSAPQPITATRAAAIRRWPSSPRGANRDCRE
jgi:hypothetical protein